MLIDHAVLRESEVERQRGVLRSLRTRREDFARRLTGGQVTGTADREHARLTEFDSLVAGAESRLAEAERAPDGGAAQLAVKMAAQHATEARLSRDAVPVVARRVSVAVADLRRAAAGLLEVVAAAERAEAVAGLTVGESQQRTGEQLADLLSDPLVRSLLDAGR